MNKTKKNSEFYVKIYISYCITAFTMPKIFYLLFWGRRQIQSKVLSE